MYDTIKNMKRGVLFFGGILCLLLSACSDGTEIQINILTPAGEEAIKTDIASDMQSSGHKGIFFLVQELTQPVSEVSINRIVTGGESLSYPTTNIGLDPTKARFTIKSGQLDQSKPYVIRIRAFDVNNTETHSGISDCFIDFSKPNRNVINICFKELGSLNNCDSKGFQDFDTQCQ